MCSAVAGQEIAITVLRSLHRGPVMEAASARSVSPDFRREPRIVSAQGELLKPGQGMPPGSSFRLAEAAVTRTPAPS